MIDNETYSRRLQESEDRATMELAVRNTELFELRSAFAELRADLASAGFVGVKLVRRDDGMHAVIVARK